MKTRTNSYMNSRRRVAQSLKETVCAWLEWDEIQYAEFQYECGLRYLRFYIQGDEWGRDMLQRSKLFWNWWKAQWGNRDAVFCDVESGEPQFDTENLRRLYRHHNDPANLASEIYPGRTVLDDSYCTMMANLIKEVVA